MGVSSVSFWQQDQSFWNQAASSTSSVATDSTISAMFGTSTTLSSGLASIANQTALNRVNNQLTAAVQSALASIEGNSSGTTGSSSTASSSSSNSSSSRRLVRSVVQFEFVGHVKLHQHDWRSGDRHRRPHR